MLTAQHCGGGAEGGGHGLDDHCNARGDAKLRSRAISAAFRYAGGAVMKKKKTRSVQYALQWRLVGNRWRLVGNRWRLEGNRWG